MTPEKLGLVRGVCKVQCAGLGLFPDSAPRVIPSFPEAMLSPCLLRVFPFRGARCVAPRLRVYAQTVFSPSGGPACSRGQARFFYCPLADLFPEPDFVRTPRLGLPPERGVDYLGGSVPALESRVAAGNPC